MKVREQLFGMSPPTTRCLAEAFLANVGTRGNENKPKGGNVPFQQNTDGFIIVLHISIEAVYASYVILELEKISEENLPSQG